MRKNIQYVEILFCAVYCFQDNFRAKKVLAPSKNHSKSPIMCFARIKKITYRTIRNSDALIVKIGGWTGPYIKFPIMFWLHRCAVTVWNM